MSDENDTRGWTQPALHKGYTRAVGWRRIERPVTWVPTALECGHTYECHDESYEYNEESMARAEREGVYCYRCSMNAEKIERLERELAELKGTVQS